LLKIKDEPGGAISVIIHWRHFADHPVASFRRSRNGSIAPIINNPDFVCQLNDGRIMVVEYKGADRWTDDDSKEKRKVGELWAERSHGRCLFVMPKGKDWNAIHAAARSR
jgi:hypothetical protein